MKNKLEPSTGSIVLYKDPKGELQLDVRLEKETVWLSQTQMAQLFQKDVRTISEHIHNVYFEGELKEGLTLRKFRIVRSEGGRKVQRTIEYYSLDVIISVGYRVKSLQGTQFRIWATKTLKDYLLQGYVVNQKRLLEQKEKFLELQRAVKFLTEKSNKLLLEDQTRELLLIINAYTNSLSLLFQYDEGKIKPFQKQKPTFVLTYDYAKDVIESIKKELQDKREVGLFFGQESGDKFKSAVSAIYQTFDGRDLYKTVEEKAANILYLTIKDHPFTDGNKRIASLLFIYFLDKNNYLWRRDYERKIADSTLVVLALLIAESEPNEKEVMVNLITNLLRD